MIFSTGTWTHPNDLKTQGDETHDSFTSAFADFMDTSPHCPPQLKNILASAKENCDTEFNYRQESNLDVDILSDSQSQSV